MLLLTGRAGSIHRGIGTGLRVRHMSRSITRTANCSSSVATRRCGRDTVLAPPIACPSHTMVVQAAEAEAVAGADFQKCMPATPALNPDLVPCLRAPITSTASVEAIHKHAYRKINKLN